MLTPVLFVIGAYLWGGIPTTYLVARYKTGIDIREFGSGNMGASNAMAHVGKWSGLLLGTFDCVGKGILPVLLARLLDQSLGVQVGIGLAAIAGHNWTPFLRFTGGRGVATAVGLIVVFALWWEAIILVATMGVLGRLIFKDTGLWTFLSMLVLPVLAFLFNRPIEILVMTMFIGILLIAKRLTANWEPPYGSSLIRIMLYRILWDRDVARKVEWTQRIPQSERTITKNP